MYFGKDVICVLPTGYGKSLIFHLVSMLLFAKYKHASSREHLRNTSIAVVNSLMSNDGVMGVCGIAMLMSYFNAVMR